MTSGEEKDLEKNTEVNEEAQEEPKKEESSASEDTATAETTAETTEKPGNPERKERAEKSERPERKDRPEKSDRTERPERPARAERPTRGDRPERPARGDRPERPKRSARAKEEEPKEETPSPNQPQLDLFVKLIETHLGKDAIAESYINRSSKDVPTIVATKEYYFKVAECLKTNEQLNFDYLSDLHGIDYETHMEVYVHLYSMTNKHSIALKVKVDREKPIVDSLVPIWQGANWPESEAYDLLGMQFTGHPDLKRILLGEDWKGYPLRKDYEPYDVEV